MSEKIYLPYDEIIPVAREVVNILKPACERIEIAGSLRRKCETIGDIEIVAIPKPIGDLFGQPTGGYELDYLLEHFDVTFYKNGPKYKKFAIQTKLGSALVDLFLQPDPATWGVNFMIRTGSREFSRRMVTSKYEGGLRPPQYFVEDARVWVTDVKDGKPVALNTPEEEDIFTLWEMDFIPPQERI